jgi:glycosyltransferase involved in cell wall biosynthesis
LLDEIRAAGYRNVLVVDGYSKDRTLEMARGRGIPIPVTSVTSLTGSLRLTGPTESGDGSIVRQRLIYLTGRS